jgi:hypothetical protein
LKYPRLGSREKVQGVVWTETTVPSGLLTVAFAPTGSVMMLIDRLPLWTMEAQPPANRAVKIKTRILMILAGFLWFMGVLLEEALPLSPQFGLQWKGR